MSRELRNGVATFLFAVSFVSFIVQLKVFFGYFAIRPTSPNPALGFVYPLHNHGFVCYLNAHEAMTMKLLMGITMMAFPLCFLIVPKEVILPPAGTPRWITRVSAQFKTDLTRPSRKLKIIFAVSVVIWLGVLYFAGPHIADLALAFGMNPMGVFGFNF